jgi:glycosyltransferase involved in cell wall biosynthesis
MAPVLPQGRVVSIVYDLIPLKFPELFPSHAVFRVQLKRLLRRSAAIVAISRRTKEDLVEMMGADTALVRVIYPGRDSTFQPVPLSQAADVAKRYGLVGPYVLYVGAMGPHKNVPALLRAYQRARLDGRLALKLLVVGGQRWGREAIDLAHSLSVRDDIVFAGEIPREDLPSLYSGATVFVFPSRYEGFGLPVLEAMACGTPVITSNQGALPEVVGAAGHCVAPDDEALLADAMCRVASDPTMRARMSTAGRERAATFSWTHSAEQLRTLLHEVGGRSGQDG